MAKTRFVYRGGDRTVESVVRKSKQAGSLYDSYLSSEVQFFKVKEGESTVRILPPTWEDTEKWGDGWEVGVYLHYNVGPDNGAYLCLDKMKGESCPVCEARRQTNDEDEADQLKPSYRTLCWVIDRDNEKAGPMVWSMPITLFKDINARSVDKKTNTPILIDDPEEGYDVVFSRAGTDKKTKYSAVEVLREPTPLHDDEKLQQRWLDYVTEHPLPDVLTFFDAEHIEKVLFGKAERKPAEEAEDETPIPTTRRRLAAAQAEEVVEEDAEPTPRRANLSRRQSEPEPEEVEPEPTPRVSRRSALLAEVEEEPPFEEEAEETPRNRAGAGAGRGSVVEQARRSLERLKPRR